MDEQREAFDQFVVHQMGNSLHCGTVHVPESLCARIKGARKVIDKGHPWGLTLQEVCNVLIVCGLDAIELYADVEETPIDSELHAAFRMKLRASLRGEKPEFLERIYEDSASEPLTASEQGRD